MKQPEKTDWKTKNIEERQKGFHLGFILSLVLGLLLTGCKYFKNPAEDDPRLQIKPKDVTGIKFESEKDGIRIEWNPEPDAIGYKVYRMDQNNEFKLVGNTQTHIGFPDNDVKPNQVFTYKVTAIYPVPDRPSANVEGSLKVKPVSYIPPPPPTGPPVQSVTYQDRETDRPYQDKGREWVKATKDFRITIIFSEPLNEEIPPVITLQRNGSILLRVQGKGEFRDGNKEYVTSAIKLIEGMDGEITVAVSEARDLDGNVMQEDQAHGFRLDATPPQTTDNAPKDEKWQPQPFRLILTATDNLSGVKATHYTRDGSQPTPNSPKYAGPIQLNEDKQWMVKYFSVDVAGNVEPIKTVMVRVDTTPPDAPSMQAQPDTVKEARLVFRWNSVDDLPGIVRYESKVTTDDERVIPTKEWRLGDRLETIVTADDGVTGCTTYFARVRAQNGAGLWSDWSEPPYEITVVLPQTGVLIVSGQVTQLGQPAPDGLTVTVTIKRGNRIISSQQTTVGKEGVPGEYTETFVDFNTNCAATVGDTIEVIVTENGGKIGETRRPHKVSLVDIQNQTAVVEVIEVK